MTDLPFMPMYWRDFFGDGKVQSLTVEQQGVYALLLGHMWLHKGWLPNNDVIIARVLGMHTNTWKQRYKAAILPLLTLDPSEQTPGGLSLIPGGVLRQNRLGSELEKARQSVEKRKAQTAKAREEKQAKSKQHRSVAARVNGSATTSVTETVTTAYARAEPEPEEPTSQGDEGSGSPKPPPAPPPARPPAVGASGLPNGGASAERFSGPFAPSAPSAPRPRVKSAFLRDWEAAGGDVSKLPVREGAPHLRENAGDDALWDQVNAKFQPPPKEDSGHERQHDAAAPDDEPPIDPDDRDDLLRF